MGIFLFLGGLNACPDGLGHLFAAIMVLRTGCMEHPPISSTLILKFSSNLGKIGPKKMLGGVVLPPGTLFSPGASFSQ